MSKDQVCDDNRLSRLEAILAKEDLPQAFKNTPFVSHHKYMRV